MRSFLDKYKNMSVQAKAALWFVACSFLQKGISFVTVPIFTRMMSTDEYGLYSLYLSWFQVLTIITSLNLFYGVLDNGMTKFDDDRDRYIAAMQGITISLTSICFIIYLCARGFWNTVLGLSPLLIGLMFIEMYVSPALSFWSGRQRFEYKYKRLVIITLLRSLLNPLLGILLVYFVNPTATSRVTAMVFVEIIICGTIMVFQFIKGKTFFDKKYWKYALSLAFPMLPHYLAGTILNQGDRIMIEKMVSTSAVAYYSVAYSIGMLVHIFTNAINSAMTPWLYQKMKSKDLSATKEVLNGLLLFVAVISFCMMIVSPELVLIFGSGKYIQGQYVIPPVAGSVFFIFLYGVFSLPQFYYEKTKFLMVASISAAIVNIGLNYYFIKLFGFVAAGYTTLACYILYSLGHFLVSRKVLSQELPGQTLFDIKTIGALSLSIILTAALINIVFPYTIIRYAILVGVLAIVVIKRKTIVNNLSIIKKK